MSVVPSVRMIAHVMLKSFVSGSFCGVSSVALGFHELRDHD